MTNTFERVLNVISKKPEQRQDFEIQGLLPWLRKKSKIFATLKTDYLKDIVRNCSLGKFNRDDVIIRQGEIGDCFYIILAGKISIHILNKDKDGGSSETDEKDAFSVIGSLNQDGVLDRTKLGNFVTSLGSGFPFGEVALVSDDAVRTATIIAEEETDLLVVDRALYNRAVRDVLAEEFEEKQQFIRENELFSSWIPKYKKQLTMAMYKEIFPYDSVLVKQGDTVGNIYFIISGQVEIRCDTSYHTQQYPKLYKLLEDEREKLIKEKKQKRQQQQENVETTSLPLKKKENSKLLKLCYLGKNESLGEMEVLMDMDTYMTTAVCTEKTEVLVLEMKHYERLFVKKHQRTIDSMRRNLENKLSTRTSVLKEYDGVPLLKLLQMKLSIMHNPPPTQDDNRKKKPETSVQIAEKLFFNHQGPLLDIDGPGSVFYMIRARERSRLKRLAYQQERNNARTAPQNGHVHSLRLPQTLVMAANMAGATETSERSDYEIDNETSVSFRVPREHMYDRENAFHNGHNGLSEVTETFARNEVGENCVEHNNVAFSGALPDSMPKSFRRIQSAVKENTCHSVDFDVSESPYESQTKSLSSSRPTTRFENYKAETNLKHLESKVADWLRKDNPKTVPNVSKLRRLPVEEMEPPPKPGNKIVIRRRPRGVRSESSTGTGSSFLTGRSVSMHKPDDRDTLVKISKDENSAERFKILLAN